MQIIKFIKSKIKQMETKQALDRLDSIEKEAAELRKIIENSNKPKNIMDRVKTFSDACEVLGINPNQITNNALDTVDEIAYKKLKIITQVLNEGWKPDWTNLNECKYFPWFEVKNKPGSSFGSSDFNCWYRSSVVSSRLALKSKELALYSAKQFEQIHYDYMIFNK